MGAVEELTSSVQGKVEVVWQGTQVPASMKALGAECHVTGDTVRAVLAENQQDAAIDALRRERIRLDCDHSAAHIARSLFRREAAAFSNDRGDHGMNAAHPAYRLAIRFAKPFATAFSTI